MRRRDIKRWCVMVMAVLVLISGIFLMRPRLTWAPDIITISTIADPTNGFVGAVLNDSATLTSLINTPTGTITFNLYGPSDQTCSAAAIFSNTVTVSGNGTYNTSAGFTTTEPGTYQWRATYSGDNGTPPNPSVGTACGSETVVIKALPTINTTPNPTSGLVGAVLNDSAVLIHGDDPEGTITFKLYGVSDQTCSAAAIFSNTVTVSGNGTYNTSAGFTTVAAGTYHWIATYSGDDDNNGVSSICADEAVVIKALPTIHTTPNPTSGLMGAVLNDSAALAGGASPTGTITFTLYGPGDQTCSAAAIFSNTVTVSGNGMYNTSAGFTTTAAGTYHWIATYSGDAGNNGVSSICADEAVLIKALPTIHTTPNPTSGLMGAVLNDSAALAGGASPTGTITFNLYGPGDQTCSAAAIFSNTVTVSGNGTYNTSAGFTTTAAGTYHWIATYSGDAGNNGVSSICADEAVLIKALPTIHTTPNPASGSVGAVLNDSAALANGAGPTGTITFKLYGVSDQTCSAAAIFSNTVTVSGNGTYNTSAGFTTTAAGTYRWIATYSGDASNNGASGTCGDETVVIKALPTITTTPNPASGSVGAVLNDSAALANGASPTGTITFKLFGPSDQTCSAAAIFSNTVTVSGNGTYNTSAGFTTVATGTYHWIATYSGDAGNNGASGTCGDETVVIKALPTINTTPNPTSGLMGAVLNDSAALANGASPTGTITFKLFGPSDQTCSAAAIFTNTVPVSGNGTYNTSAGFTTVAAGTYHWIATYSGDAGNNGVSSLCVNEAVLIVNQPPQNGENPYIGIVGNDIAFNSFYFSQKQEQFLYDQTLLSVPVCFGSFPIVTPQTRVGGAGCEQFRSNTPIDQPEICDTLGVVNGVGDFTFFGEPNAVIRKQNAGYYEWFIRLPRKPSGEINIVIQCGILKPNTFAFEGFNAVELCAAETGERIGTGFCTRDQFDAGVNPIINSSLPRITAIAYPGPFSLGFAPFHLTAYKNPGTYALSVGAGGAATNSVSLQVLDGSVSARVLLKSCMDKAVVAKIPVTDQLNAAGEVEADLEAGDLIYVRMDVPINNTVDIYCHSQSTRLAGIGEEPF